MKPFLVLLLCLLSQPALAQHFEFRGEFVDTYMADKGFLDTLPAGTRLNCEDGICSKSKSVRIYVFRNGQTTKRFWSTDYCDVMFDEPEAIASCGKTGHVAYYDETNQLLFRDPACR